MLRNAFVNLKTQEGMGHKKTLKMLESIKNKFI